MIWKLRVVGMVVALFLTSGCMTIKESHVHIHDSDGANVNVHIQGSDAEDSLNGNEGKVQVPLSDG